MAITNGYLTRVEFKSALNIQGDSQDERIDRVIEAASRRIDAITGRFFYVTEEETRYYDVDDVGYIYTDDLVTITSIATDDGNLTFPTSWISTDYDLLPYNATALGIPYSSLQVATQGRYTFPRGRKTVRVVGTFGWSAVPADIKEATLILANRLRMRRDAPFGVVGSQEFGQINSIVKVDPDVQQILEPYRRMFVGVI